MEKSKYLITEEHLLFSSTAVTVEFSTYEFVIGALE